MSLSSMCDDEVYSQDVASIHKVSDDHMSLWIGGHHCPTQVCCKTDYKFSQCPIEDQEKPKGKSNGEIRQNDHLHL